MKLKKVDDDNSNVDSSNREVLQKQKERRIVSWSQEEDDVLREQIQVYGTENWAIIASNFKDKTTRQCRRRWFTYLNSDFKKGGWSPEEDMLLCEAQKMYGNRWTEIAKMVPGRTDNAVKNRFTTLCKKRAKRETLANERSTKSYVNLNNKRVLSHSGFNVDGSPKSDEPMKRIRTGVLNMAEHVKLAAECGTEDPKVLALMQQAEILGSPARKANADETDQSVDVNVYVVSDDYLEENKESDLLMMSNSDTGFQLEKCKESMEDPRGCNEGRGSSLREHDVYESSPANSECSTGSTLLSNTLGDTTEKYEAEIGMQHQEIGLESQPDQLDHRHCLADAYRIGYNASMNEVENIVASDMQANEGGICNYSCMEFSSPLHVTPLFRALAAAIPSPQFSESEKHFLMKTLGMESPSSNPMTNTSHPPTCKRSLLHCL